MFAAQETESAPRRVEEQGIVSVVLTHIHAELSRKEERGHLISKHWRLVTVMASKCRCPPRSEVQGPGLSTWVAGWGGELDEAGPKARDSQGSRGHSYAGSQWESSSCLAC